MKAIHNGADDAFIGEWRKIPFNFANAPKKGRDNHFLITFALKPLNMTIREWIRHREISGFPTFYVEDIRLAFPNHSEQVIRNELFRLSSQGILYSAYKGFYIIIPPQYAAKKIVPPIYYIDQLMSYLKKPYYIGLLSAAEILGAAHQRPQKFSVMTIYPKSSVSPSKNNTLVWTYRKEIPSDLLLTKNSETGVIHYSNVELTSIDIVQYEQYIGGLSRAATILEELAEKMDFRDASQNLFCHTSIATIQRLGYILEEVLEQKEIAEVLYAELLLYTKRFRYVPLKTNRSENNAKKNTRWKVNINLIIETDEI